MHTFRGDGAMTRQKRSSPTRASPAGRWPPPAQPDPQPLPRTPPLPPLGQWPRPPPPRSTRPKRTAREDPPRHSREPLRRPGPGGPPRPAAAPPHPCLRHAGTCSPHALLPRATLDGSPTAQSAAPGSCTATGVPSAGVCTPASGHARPRRARRLALVPRHHSAGLPEREALPHCDLEQREDPRLTWPRA